MQIFVGPLALLALILAPMIQWREIKVLPLDLNAIILD